MKHNKKETLDTTFLAEYHPEGEPLGTKSNQLIRMITDQMNSTGSFPFSLSEALQDVLRCLVIDDRLTGLAAIPNGSEKTVENKPLVCIVASALASTQQNTEVFEKFLDELATVINHPDIIAAFPEIITPPDHRRLPREDKNFLIEFHYKIVTTPAYPVLAVDLQLGLPSVLKAYSWGLEEKELSAISSMRTGLVRLFHEFSKQEAEDLTSLITMESWSEAEVLCREICLRLRKEKDPDEPLRLGAINAYVWGFMQPIVYKNVNREERKKQNRQYTSHISAGDIDNDPPDTTSDEVKETLHQIEITERNEIDPDSIFDDVMVEDPKQLRFASDDLAVMINYQSWLAWNKMHPSEIGLLLVEMQNLVNQKITSYQMKTLLDSLIFTGRRLEWLCSVRIGDMPDELSVDSLEYPIYDPKLDAVFYRPDTFADIAQTPQNRQELCLHTSRLWCLPLPIELVSLWRACAQGREPGESLFNTSAEKVLGRLKNLSKTIHQQYPSMPEFTLGRIRGAFSAMMINKTGMNPGIAAVLSDQRSLVPNATLFYNTFSIQFLANEYRNCTTSLIESMINDFPQLKPYYRSAPAKLPENYLIGSGYYPKIEALITCLTSMFSKVAQESDQQKRHNLITILFLYLMSLLCGLRISECADLLTGQFDRVHIRPGVLIRLLHLPETRSSRFAFASRVVPLPEILWGLLDFLLSESKLNKVAFFFYDTRGKPAPIKIDNIRNALENLDLPFPRWHAGRHLLRSHLLTSGMDDRAINAVLGHTREGEELFNPYRAGDITAYWEAYLKLADKLAEELGVKELINQLNNELKEEINYEKNS